MRESADGSKPAVSGFSPHDHGPTCGRRLRAVEEGFKLGEIRCPSGTLVVIDGGHLGAWSGERSPAEIDPALLGVDDAEVMRQIRASGLGTGTVDIGDARLLCTMTTWGDGRFPVSADLDASGSVVAVQVSFSGTVR